MIPLADIHCHLLAGLDDGPQTDDEALEMCRMAHADGTRLIAAGAHQNEDYPANTAARIRESAERLGRLLREHGIAISTFPSAEICLHPDMEAAWERGELLSVADRRQHLLVEMPHAAFVDIRELSERFRRRGVRLILAHPERNAELLHCEGAIEDVIRAGCLVQVSAQSVTRPKDRRDERALRRWLTSGLVHFLGSDGHSPRRRRPTMADAYQQIIQWAGTRVADRVCSTNGQAIAMGLPATESPPPSPRTSWLGRLLGKQ